MKTNFFLATAIAACVLVFGCSKCKDDACLTDVSIASVLPNSNPVGYEVLLKTTGFSDSAKVVFGSVEAVSRPGGAAGEIIAQVPAGLSGNVEISVEDGDCIARSADFSVLGALPSNSQPSPDVIIVPVPLTNAPTESVANQWKNFPDENYKIQFDCDLSTGQNIVELESSSEERLPDGTHNPVTGSVNIATNTVYMKIDRTGIVEIFDGQFIEVPNYLPAGTKYAILFLSRETGRQLLIYYFN